jgi:hypothetical protein
MWDEISITKDMKWGNKSLNWKGIVDYAGEGSIMIPKGLADHALVFVFIPFFIGFQKHPPLTVGYATRMTNTAMATLVADVFKN